LLFKKKKKEKKDSGVKEREEKEREKERETIPFWFLLEDGILHRSETFQKIKTPTVHKAQENVRKKGKT